MKKILIFLLMLQLFVAKGQHEFIGIINPSTGTDNIIDSIPGDELIYSGISTFDDNNHRFIFYGIDFSGNKHLYCINAITGAILSQATFTLNVCEFQYDNSSNKLYTLYNAAGNILTLASVDINTGVDTTITTYTISGCGGGTTFFDEANHAFVIQNSGSFYSVNVNTGSITITPAPTAFNEIKFDNTTGIPYGLVSAGPSMYLVRINVSNGTYVAIDTFPSGYNPIETAFDETNHIYNYGNNNYLYSINVNTGAVSSTVFPVGISTMTNFELEYDNSNGILYSIQWGTLPNTTDGTNQTVNNNEKINIYPNPTKDKFFVDVNTSDKLNVSLFDLNGRLLLSKSVNNKENIDVTNLNEGVYDLTIKTADGVINKKLVIVR